MEQKALPKNPTREELAAIAAADKAADAAKLAAVEEEARRLGVADDRRRGGLGFTGHLKE